MDYGNLLSRAWQIVWYNKFMFILGFLAALGSGGRGGGGNVNFRTSSRDIPPEMVDNFQRFLDRFGFVIIGLVCVLFVLAILFWLLRLTAQGGLISAAARIDAGEKVTLSEAFAAGAGKLGRVVGINVLMYGPFTLVGLVGALTVLAMVTAALSAGGGGAPEAVVGSLGILMICLACLACLMIPGLVVVSGVYPFAQRGIILQDLGVIASIRHGWQVVRENLGEVVLLIILFLVIGGLFTFALALVLIPLAFLSLGPAAIRMMSTQAVETLDILMIVGGGICLGFVAAAVQSILVAFRSTAVTLAYQEFVGKHV
ncbi:MAG: hypothetical protein ACE5E7_04915 [Anaerolineae bacterium]